MAIQIKFTNNFVATLAAAISDADTAITLDAGSGAKLPNYGGGDYEYMTLGNTANNLEIVKVTARVGDILTVVRGVDGTTAKAWSAGDQINSRPCAAAMNDALQVNVAKADVDSQVFTGTPVLPTGTIAVTQAAGNSTTKIATTAFVTSAIATAETAMEAYADAAVEAATVFEVKQTASGNTEFEFLTIPAGVKRITMTFVGLSTSSTPGYGVQLGTSAGYKVTDYDTTVSYWDDAYKTVATMFGLHISTVTAAVAYTGGVTLTRHGDGDDVWICEARHHREGAAVGGHAYLLTALGSVSLAGELDRVKLLFDGVNTFDAGSVSVFSEV